MDKEIQDVISSRLDLEIQCNLNQNSSYFVNINKLILKSVLKIKDAEEPTQYWRETKLEDRHCSASRLTKKQQYWNSVLLVRGQTDRWMGPIESKVEPHTWATDLWQKSRVVQWGKDSLFNHLCWNNWTSAYKRIDLDTDLIPLTKLNFQWITNLNKTSRR